MDVALRIVLSGITAVLSLLTSSCEESRDAERWPDDTSFVIIDEHESNNMMDNADQLKPSLGRVLLIPVVLNYNQHGTIHSHALVDPIVAIPGEKSMKELVSPWEQDGQSVSHFIVMANGYAPGFFGPNFNYSAQHHGGQAWLVELTKLEQPDDFNKLSDIVLTELSGGRIHVEEKERSFSESLKDLKYLSTFSVLSPIDRFKHMPEYGTSYHTMFYWLGCPIVEICITPQGMQLIREEMKHIGESTPSGD